MADTFLHPAENQYINNFLSSGQFGVPTGMAYKGHEYERYGLDDQINNVLGGIELGSIGHGVLGPLGKNLGIAGLAGSIGKHYGWWGKEQRPFTDMPSSIPIGGGAELDVQKIWQDPKRYAYTILPDYTYGAPGAPGGPSFSGAENYVQPGTQATIGGQAFRPMGNEAQASKINELLKGLQYDRPWRDEEREYLSTAGALREAIGAAYGINTGGRIGMLDADAAKKRKEELGLTGDYDALDPVVQLEQQLEDRYRNYQMQQNQGLMNQMFQGRNQALNNMLQAQSAAMGTPGLYQGVIGANEASRDTLMNQAKAAYKPIQSAMEQQYEQANQQLLATLQQLQAQTEATVRSVGKQGAFEREA